jgi:tetratricopeptide (TPR) repeat protein
LFDGSDPQTDIRAVFSWSYQTLSEPAARLLRLLGLCAGPDIALPAAASLAGLPARHVRPLLAELTRAHLLTETSPGRFGCHDLLRAYAIELAHRHDTAQQQAAARHRFLDHHLHTAHDANRLLRPAPHTIHLAAPVPGVTPERLVDRDAALTWFDAERTTLIAAVTGQPDGFDRHTWQIASALLTYLNLRGQWQDNERVQRAGLNAVRRLGDLTGQAWAHRNLGNVHALLDKPADAQRHNQAALRLFEQAGNLAATADVHFNLSIVHEQVGDLRLALTHAERAHHIYRSFQQFRGQAGAANTIGWIHGRLGDNEAGRIRCREALKIFTEIDDKQGIASTCDSLGVLHRAIGNPWQAIDYCHEAIKLFDDLGYRYCQADAYISLSTAHDQTGNRHAARQARHQALSISDDLEPHAAARIQARLRATATS